MRSAPAVRAYRRSCRSTGGRADFGIDGSGLLVELANGRKVVALAAIFQKPPLRLIARADGGIRRSPIWPVAKSCCCQAFAAWR